MRRIFAWITLACCGLSLGCSSLGLSNYPVAHLMTRQTERVLEASPRRPSVPRELAKEVMPAHYLEPGDELLIEVLDFDSEVRLPTDQRVLADGTVDLGAFGRVVIAGMTLEQAEAAIQRALVIGEVEPTQVNVRLVEPIHHYYVIGEVNSPGAYPLIGNETVLDGLMAAGGVTSRASACQMLLARPTHPSSCRVTLPVCYRAITQLGDSTTNYQLRPGDRIFVARQTWLDELCFWRAAETCERCCDRERACRDTSTATYHGSEFGAIGDPWIVPPPVEDPEVIPAEGPAPAPSPAILPEGSQPEAKPQPGVGELDFSQLMEIEAEPIPARRRLVF